MQSKLEGKKVEVLVDYGAIINFVNKDWAERNRVKKTPISNIIYTINGTPFAYQGINKEYRVALELEGIPK